MVNTCNTAKGLRQKSSCGLAGRRLRDIHFKLLVSILVAICIQAVHAQDLTQVVFGGDPAPGLGCEDAIFSRFGTGLEPVINTDGLVVFSGLTQGSCVDDDQTTALYRWSVDGGLSFIAKTGDTFPGPRGEEGIGFIVDAIIDELGNVAFEILVGNTFDNAILMWDGAGIERLLGPGDPVTLKIYNFNTQQTDPFADTIRSVGGLATRTAAFRNGRLAVVSTDTEMFHEDTLWLIEGDTRTLLKNTGELAPGYDKKSLQSFFDVALNSEDEVVVNAEVNDSAQHAIYRCDPDCELMISGWDHRRQLNWQHLRINEDGFLAFDGGVRGEEDSDIDFSSIGVYVVPGIRQVTSVFATPAPGLEGATIGFIEDLSLFNGGQVAYGARLSGGEFDGKVGAWTEARSGDNALIIHEGQTAPALKLNGDPGAGDNAAIKVDRLDVVHVNEERNHVVIGTIAGGGVTFQTSNALWGLNPVGKLVEVLRAGDGIILESGEPRTIESMSIVQDHAGLSLQGPAYGGHRSAFNGNGQLAMHIVTNGPLDMQDGIFVLKLEPVHPPKLAGLEVVQTVQDWENSIPLIAHKETWVRAHIETLETPVPVKLYGRLSGKRDGQKLGAAPLEPSNPGGFAFSSLDAQEERKDLGQALYFKLPQSTSVNPGQVNWPQGTVEFEISLRDTDLDCKEATGPVAKDCKTTVEFELGKVPQLHFLAISYLDNGVRHVIGMDDRLAQVRLIISQFPVSRLDWKHRVVDYEELRSPDLPAVPEVLLMAALANLYRTNDKCSTAAGCKRIYYSLMEGVFDGDGLLGIGKEFYGAGFLPRNKKVIGRHTTSHELGHIVGHPHAGNKMKVGSETVRADGKEITWTLGACGSLKKPQEEPGGRPDFPNFFPVKFPNKPMDYIEGKPLPTLGPMDKGDDKLVFGLDSILEKAVDPEEFFAMMSYCSVNPVDLFVSDFNYKNIKQSLETLYTQQAQAANSGGLAPADYWWVSGFINAFDNSVEFMPVAFLEGLSSPDVSPTGPYTLEVRDKQGVLQQTISFAAQRFEECFRFSRGDDPDFASFFLAIPSSTEIGDLRVFLDGEMIGQKTASPGTPAVEPLTPVPGANLATEDVTVTWSASDPDDDPLDFMLDYSADGGDTWSSLANVYDSTELVFPRSSIEGTSQGRFRIQASDGMNVATDVMDGTFSVANNPPEVLITSPENGRLFTGNQEITLSALTYDQEDGADIGIVAWSSDLEGILGSGHQLSVNVFDLSEGLHTLTAMATDDDSSNGSDAVMINILREAPTVMSDLDVTVIPRDSRIVPGDPATLDVIIRNEGPQASTPITVDIIFEDPANDSIAAFENFAAPEGVDCVLAETLLNCDFDGLDLDSEHSVEITVINTSQGTLSLMAAADVQDNFDPREANNTASAVVLVNPFDEEPPPAAGITVTPTSGLVTTEAGGSANFSIVLNTQPSANVSIGLSSSDTSEGTVAPTSVTFTNGNWNTPQTVTVTGVDDALVDGDIAYNIITAPATSGDGDYSGLNPADVSAINSDNDVVAPVFKINAGLNDAWFNLATAGQGFFFVVFPDIELFFLSWFTFDLERPDEDITAMLGEPGHRWVTAFGAWEGNTVSLDVELTSGGIFDSAEPLVEQQSNYGTITIVFHDCNNATLTYDFPTLGLMGTIELTRVTEDNVVLCEELNAQQG